MPDQPPKLAPPSGGDQLKRPGKTGRSIVIPLGIGAVPLAVYPFVAIASLMSLAARATTQPKLLIIVARSAQIGSLLYPLVYLGCLMGAIVLRKKESDAAFSVSLVPLFSLGFIFLLFVLWYLVERGSR